MSRKLKRGVTRWTPATLVEHIKTVSGSTDGVTYGPVRPEGMDTIGHRLKMAWRVFTGQYDVLNWPRT